MAPTSNATATRTLVIGVGNPFRQDDGVGYRLAEQLARFALPGVTVIQASGEGAELLEVWKGYERVILIDAVASGAPAGTVHELDAVAEPVPAGFFNYSTHAFSVAEAVELARSLDRLPGQFLLFGIEGKTFDNGTDLSTEVQRAAERVLDRIRERLALVRPTTSTTEGRDHA